MKRYFDIYIRPAGTVIDDTALEAGNIMDGWDRLDLPAKGAKLSVEGVAVELGDGTQYIDGEKVNIEAGTLRVDSTEFAYLRSTFHNVKCDVLFYDAADSMIAALAYGLRMSVQKLVQSGETIICKIMGSKVAHETEITLLTPAIIETYGLLRGKVYAEDGTTPVAGVLVSISADGVYWEDTTDKDGEYLICMPAQASVTFTPTKSGWTFPETTSAVIQDQEVVKNITAKEDGA